MNKKLVIFILACITALALFFNNYNREVVPPCFNADEAAFSYNAYSLAKTGKDEYGTFLPLRLKSFGDYKMPLYSYLSVPFISIFGLNETSARGLNILLTLVFPVTIYLLSKALFKRDDIALVSAFLISCSLALHILGRHTHEALLSAYLTILTAYMFIRLHKKLSPMNIAGFLVSILLLLFSYHPGRIFTAYFFVCLITFVYIQSKVSKKVSTKQILTIIGFIVVTSLFIFTDVLYKPERVKNLLFFNNAGFSLKINELRAEGGPKLFYNKLTLGARDLADQYSRYFSPDFLAINGDENIRFGFASMSPLSLLEYLFFLVGLYYLFKNNEKYRYFIIGLLLTAPFSAALSWAGMSITRSLALFAIIPLISGYGVVYLIRDTKAQYRYALISIICVIEMFFLFYSWDFYLNHYATRAMTIRSWQCGYKDLTDYVKTHYDSTEKFYITKKNGEPYIFLLFYMQYPPEKYQKEANLSKPDEYGFGQVEKFDKFDFNFKLPQSEDHYIAIGYPDDFAGASPEILSKVTKIKRGTEEIFWIYNKD